MADAPKISTAETFDKPVSSPVDSSSPLIFTMPAEYRHGGVGKVLHIPKSTPLPPPTSPQQELKPSPKPPTVVVPKKTSVISRPLLIGGGILLCVLLFGAGALFFWPSKEEVPIASTPRPSPPVTRPPVETPPPVIPKEPKEEPEDPSPFPSAIVPGTDTDSDGLTDLEERTIYNTDPRLPDSDADGFLDGNEVYHRYNPNGTAPGTLLESGLVRAFTQPVVSEKGLPGTRILFPAGWSTSGEAPEVQFKAVTGEMVTYTLLKKDTPEQTLAAWKTLYGSKDPVVASTSKNGYPVLVTENQLVTYVDLGTVVGVLTYSTGIKGTVDYLQSFQMMTNSLETTF